MATAASAATGPVIPTKEQAGYQFTGAQFPYAQATVYLRNAAQYSASVGGLGQSIQFSNGGQVYVLGVSDTTTSGPYRPAMSVFNSVTHALLCSTTGNNCGGTPVSWANGSLSYPSGHSVQEEIYYKTNGFFTYTVNDLTAKTTSGGTMMLGVGTPSFTQVRIGTEFGDTPWSVPAFTAPVAQVKTATFSGGRLTNSKGTKFGFSGYFTTSPLIMTGPGSVTEASAGALNSTADGFSTYLVP